MQYHCNTREKRNPGISRVLIKLIFEICIKCFCNELFEIPNPFGKLTVVCYADNIRIKFLGITEHPPVKGCSEFQMVFFCLQHNIIEVLPFTLDFYILFNSLYKCFSLVSIFYMKLVLRVHFNSKTLFLDSYEEFLAIGSLPQLSAAFVEFDILFENSLIALYNIIYLFFLLSF